MLRLSRSLSKMNALKLLRAPPAKWAPSVALPRREFAQEAGGHDTTDYGNVKTPSELKFDDAAAVFRYTPTKVLLRARFVFQLFRVPILVKHCPDVLKVSRMVLGERLFNRLMKPTMYGQFVGGEDDAELKGTIEQLKANGIYPVLDYAVESDSGNVKTPNERGGAPPATLNFGNATVVFRSTHTGDLFRAWIMFQSILVKANRIYPVLVPMDYAVKGNIGDTKEVSLETRASARAHLYLGEENCDKNMENFVSSIKTAARCCSGSTGFVAIKISALCCRPQFLLQLSESLAKTRKRFTKLAQSQSGSSGAPQPCITEEALGNWLKEEGVECCPQTVSSLWREMDVDQSGSVDLLDWMEFFKPGNKPHELLQNMKTSSRMYLAEDDLREMKNLLCRTHNIAKIASEVGVRVMVDAEQTYYQDAIKHIAVSELMRVYNHSSPVICNTIQCYLKRAPLDVEEDLSLAKRHGFYYDVKLVRGAYMEQERDWAVELMRGAFVEQERDWAEELKYFDPIWPTKEDTDSCYNNTVSRLMEEAIAGRVSFMVASHNKQSIMHAVAEMDRLNVSRKGGIVTFGQLYGMHDHITLTLARARFEVYKYLPYGPVGEVLPYLCRRANENSSMFKGAVEYRKFIGRELLRRLTYWLTV